VILSAFVFAKKVLRMITQNKSSGFTMIEMIIVIAIISILCGMAVVQYQKMTNSFKLDSAANSTFRDLRSVRPLAMKFDLAGKVTFKNRSYIINKFTRNDTIVLPAYIGFALTASGPSKDPFGVTVTADSGAKGSWKDSLVVKRDAIGTYNSGCVILSSSKLPKTFYYIGVSSTMQELQMYKWNGTSWGKI
jgi:prepilin-type N-terminal cleavage/methylation domain-containing protein